MEPRANRLHALHQAARGRKLRVTLVRPPVFFHKRSLSNEATPSLALAYITAFLRHNGYDPLWVDAMAEGLNQTWELDRYPGFLGHGLTLEQLLARIPADSEVIGFHAMFSSEWPMVRDLIMAVRARFPQALFVAGGEHLTALTEYSLRDCPALDVGARGEGEQRLLDILETVSAGGSLATVDGIGFLDTAGHYQETSGLPRIRNISQLPWPHWPEGYLEAFWKSGKSYGPQSARDMPMLWTRGCPFRCSFCSNPNMWTSRYAMREVDDVLAEIKHHVTTRNVTTIQLYDLTAIVKKRWIIELLEKMLAQDIRVNLAFPAGTRSEVLDDEVLTLLKKAGTTYISYAPESGSPRVLALVGKRIDLDAIFRSIHAAVRHGLTVRINMVLGFPGERRGDVLRSLWFGLRCMYIGVDEIQPYIFMPFPGSEMFRTLLATGKIELGDPYFLTLNTLNTDVTNLSHRVFNEQMRPGELTFYRLLLTLISYFVGYIFHPSRIVRTIRNIRSEHDAANVFEHRLKDALRRKKITPNH
ncbi:MAG: B12-binding domain-containing radical SAM protein [Magnetococcales bacterium]|nr:B12-binding domain-containing radical SAM protein [Magnetococcales bacterium]